MKTKRKLVPKSNPHTGDCNVVPLDVADRVLDVNSNAPAKRQRANGSGFISPLLIDVGPSGVQNVAPVGEPALPTTGISHCTLMSSSCGALPATGQTLSHSVIPTTVTRQPMEIDESSGDATHVVRVDNYSSRCPCSGMQSPVVPMFEQPRHVTSIVNNHSRARRDRTRRHPTATAGTSSQHAAPSGPPLEYKDLGNCAHSCQHCGALFWFEERLKSTPRARENFKDNHVPNFKVRLYSVIGAREYELPTGDMLGAIVYEVGPENDMDYDIVLEERSGYPKRVNKLHSSYMSLQFPILFIYGQDGYSKDLIMISRSGSLVEDKWLTVNEYLSGIYDAINRGDNDGSNCGLRLILPQSFTDEFVRPHRDEDIDMYVSAELPSQHADPQGYRIVSELMMHGPCGLANPSATYFGLRLPPKHLMFVLRNRLLIEEKSYDCRLLEIERDKLLPMLNEKQHQIFDLIVNACLNNEQKLVFVYGHGGTGKTFLWKTILHTLRCKRKIILVVASSAIASLLLPAGRTAHSRFRIPLDLTDTSVCSTRKNTQLADLLKETCLIVWDKSPMNDHRCFEMLDQTLRDNLNQPNHVFGGKTVMLGGDFRQTLPVKRGASRNEIIRSFIANSYLWPHSKVHYLTENMRLSNKNLSEIDKHRTTVFIQWLLDIRKGNIGILDDSDPENTSWVNIPDEYCIPNDDNVVTNLINFIYDDDTLHQPSAQKLQEKAIICPKNDMADVINSKILSLLTTTTRTYLSYDEAIPHGHDGGEVELLYPREYLNSLSFAGLPPHWLTLKVGSPIMLLRNINIAGGLCSGLQLSGTSATHYYLNPNIPETYHIKEQCQQLNDATHILNIDNQRYEDLEQEKNRNRFPLATLLEVDPQNYQFTSDAIIYKISTQNKWYYEKCTACGKQVILGDPVPTCKNHGPQPTPTYSNQANSLIKDCNELLTELPKKNSYELPSTLKDLEGTARIFQFHFDINNTSKRKDFVLDIVFQKTILPLLAAPVQHATVERISAEQPKPVAPLETSSPASSTTGSNEFNPQENINDPSQQSPTTHPPPEHPTKVQQENQPTDLPALSTKEETYDVNLKTNMSTFDTQEAPTDTPIEFEPSQSTPSQIENPTEADKEKPPANTTRASARKKLFIAPQKPILHRLPKNQNATSENAKIVYIICNSLAMQQSTFET
ncbi:DNA helicase [Tanacetum coccineum]